MGKELKLFGNFLTNRRQFVHFGSSAIYVNDLSNLQLPGKLYMFADDVYLFYPYKYDLVLKTYTERDVALILYYVRLNRLKLNPDKTKLIRFRSCTCVQEIALRFELVKI